MKERKKDKRIIKERKKEQINERKEKERKKGK